MQSKRLEEMKLPKLVSDSDNDVAQSCLTLCDPVGCRSPGSSIHGISQARILEWVAISFPRDLPYPGIKPRSPSLQADGLTSEPNAYKGLYGDLDVEAFHLLPLPQPGPEGSNILPGCGQTAKTLTSLWFHLFKASLEVQNFIQFFKR